MLDINDMQRLSTTKRLYRNEMTASGKAVGDHVISEDGKERHWALQNVSFQIRPGTVCAIVGRSGAGKSSMISLISRFYDVTRGRIMIGEHDIRNVSLESLSNVVVRTNT